MRILLLILSAVVFLLLFVFALMNADSVTLHYFLGFEWRAPLVIMLLAFFMIGIALGVIASLGKIVRQRREIMRLKRELRGLARGVAAPATAESI